MVCLLLPVTTVSSYEQDSKLRYYFLIGHGSKAVACWRTGHENDHWEMAVCGWARSKEGVDIYKTWFIENSDIYARVGVDGLIQAVD